MGLKNTKLRHQRSKPNLTHVIPEIKSPASQQLANQVANLTEDETANIINKIKQIARKILNQAAKKVVENYNQDNLGELWKCIKSLKVLAFAKLLHTIVHNSQIKKRNSNQGEELYSTLTEVLAICIEIIILLIRRESLVLAASVIASEASNIALCIAIYKNFNTISNEKQNEEIITTSFANISKIINRLQTQSPSKTPTNGLFIEIMFLKQVLTFLQSSSSSDEFAKAGGKIATGIFKIIIGTTTSGAGSNPFSGIRDIMKGSTDLVNAGIKHRHEIKEKIIFFAILKIRTDVSTIINTSLFTDELNKAEDLTSELQTNVYITLEEQLSNLYHNVINAFGSKVNPPVIVVISYVQLLGKLFLFFLENNDKVHDDFYDIIYLLWNGKKIDEKKYLPGLKHFITYEPLQGINDVVNKNIEKGKMYVSVVDDILKTRETLINNNNPTLLLQKIISSGRYLIDQAIDKAAEHVKLYVSNLIPSKEEITQGAKDVIFCELAKEINILLAEYKKLPEKKEIINEKINYFNNFIINGRTKVINLINNVKVESDIFLEETQTAIVNLKRFQTDVLLPIEHELDVISNMCTYILGGPENYLKEQVRIVQEDIDDKYLKACEKIKDTINKTDGTNVETLKTEICKLNTEVLENCGIIRVKHYF